MTRQANTTPPPLNAHQQAILACLHQSNTPMSAYKILHQVKGSDIYAPQQVYRALEKLTALHLIHRIESLSAYVPCRLVGKQDEAHPLIAVCRQCQTSFEFSARQTLENLKKTVADINFQSQKITIEILGLCHQCQDDDEMGNSTAVKNK